MYPYRVKRPWGGVVLPVLSVLLASASAASAGECDCDRYAGFEPVRSLALDVSLAGLRAIDPRGNAFDPGIYRVKVDTDLIVPERCRRSASEWPTPGMRVVARAGAGDKLDSAFDSGAGARFIMETYDDLLISASGCGVRPKPAKDGTPPDRAVADAFARCLQENQGKNYEETVRAFSDGRDLSRIYGELVNLSTSDQDLLDRLGKYKNRLTTRAALQLVQAMGAKLAQGYDKKRRDESYSSEGSVSFAQMLSTAQANSRNQAGSFVDDYNKAVEAHNKGRSGEDLAELDTPVDPKQWAGVCRDIASFQSKMLQTLGFKKNYVVSWAKGGTYHVTTLATDPNDPLKVYSLDYGALHQNAGGDSRAFFQGMADGTINYRVFKPGGAMVSSVQSEFGKFLTEAAGMDIRDVDPLARVHGNLVAAEASLDGKGRTQVRGGVATDGNSRYGFAALSRQYLDHPNAPGRVGVVLTMQNRPEEEAMTLPGESPLPKQDLNLDMLYIQIEQRVQASLLEFTPDLKLRVEGLAQLMLAAGRHRSAGDFTPQGDLRLNGGLRLDQSLLDNRLNLTYRARGQVVPGLANVQDMGSNVIPTWNQLLLSAEGRLRLSQTPEGRAYLIAGTTVLVDQLGRRGRAEAGIVTDAVGATVRVEGRLDDDSAVYQDGSARRAEANVSWTPADFLRVGVSGDTLLEGQRFGTGAGVMGNATVTW